jgi:hypothetical protein
VQTEIANLERSQHEIARIERIRNEVANVLDYLSDEVEQLQLNTWQLRTLSAIRRCRTSALGGHIDACDRCGVVQISYNSCRNRHCPKCQGHKREAWILKRSEELLPVPYFHVVFTLPSELISLAMYQPKVVYDSLFSSAWDTLQSFAKQQGVTMGMISILHTWGQTLSLHPHIHCIVPGGGVTKNGVWKNVRKDGKFLFSVKAMSKVFRAKYMKELRSKLEVDKSLSEQLFSKSWVVYAKKPFGNMHSVTEYLGRYTHKIAISNSRLLSVDKENVTFSYKDYKAAGKKRTMTLSNREFIRRFSLHILPRRFVKIRHMGFLSSTWKRKKLKELQKKLLVEIQPNEKQTLHRKCPCCKKGTLITIEVFAKRGPPSALVFGGANNAFSCKQ